MLQWPSNAGSAVQAARQQQMKVMTFEAKCADVSFSVRRVISPGVYLEKPGSTFSPGPSACLPACWQLAKNTRLGSEAIRSEDRDYALKISIEEGEDVGSYSYIAR